MDGTDRGTAWRSDGVAAAARPVQISAREIQRTKESVPALHKHRLPLRRVLWWFAQTPFTAESLSDVHRQDDDTEIPGYQLCLCLGWFKRLKLICQHGRQGYSLARGGDLSAAVERAWKDLPEQS